MSRRTDPKRMPARLCGHDTPVPHFPNGRLPVMHVGSDPAHEPVGADSSMLSSLRAVPPFEGYPYLVVRIGRTPLRPIALLRADWTRERIVHLAEAQALANRLDVAACFGPDDTVYLGAEEIGDRVHLREGPSPTGLPILDKLRLSEEIPTSPELAERRARLEAFAAVYHGHGFLVGDGLEGEVPMNTAMDPDRFDPLDADGLPQGMRRCLVCGQAAGPCLTRAGELVWCRCACENGNRCARCHEPLAQHRLSSWYWDDKTDAPWYVAAYAALSHRCADGG